VKFLQQNPTDFESSWQTALAAILDENKLATLQCLVLAQIYYIATANYDRLLHYRGIAISMCHRIGLHQSQKQASFGTLVRETRKKVFWTLYTLDWYA
jgi:hypothetical protein